MEDVVYHLQQIILSFTHQNTNLTSGKGLIKSQRPVITGSADVYRVPVYKGIVIRSAASKAGCAANE